jgi:hypothetical protein
MGQENERFREGFSDWGCALELLVLLGFMILGSRELFQVIGLHVAAVVGYARRLCIETQ